MRRIIAREKLCKSYSAKNIGCGITQDFRINKSMTGGGPPLGASSSSQQGGTKRPWHKVVGAPAPLAAAEADTPATGPEVQVGDPWYYRQGGAPILCDACDLPKSRPDPVNRCVTVKWNTHGRSAATSHSKFDFYCEAAWKNKSI